LHPIIIKGERLLVTGERRLKPSPYGPRPHLAQLQFGRTPACFFYPLTFSGCAPQRPRRNLVTVRRATCWRARRAS